MTYNLAETLKSIQQLNQSSTTQEESVKLIAALIALPIYKQPSGQFLHLFLH